MSLASRKLIQATAGAAGAGEAVDDDFANVVLLLDGDGTSGDDNNTFTDSSTNGFTVTETGSVVQGSFSPYGDNWSNYFDGSSYLSVPDSTDFDFGTGDFTWEAWIRTTVNVNYQSVIGSYLSNSATWGIHTNSSGTITYFTAGTTIYTGSTVVTDGEWHHIAISRSGTSIRLFVDGVQDGSTGTNSTNIANSAEVRIGSFNIGDFRYFTGYISNVRVIKGTALYTSAFTPSTSPLTAVTNTQLLISQSNRFVDNSSSSRTVTVNGIPKVTPFSPFKDDDARDITTDGGSAYFDGSSYLSTPNDTAYRPNTGAYTVEGWFYTTKSTTQILFDARQTGNTDQRVTFWVTNGDDLNYWHGTGTSTSSNVFNTGEWVYIAASRGSGTTEIYVNGTRTKSFSDSTQLYNFRPYYGARWDAGAKLDEGYLADWRITVGEKLYTGATMTVPTAPIGLHSSTDSYLAFQDAGIYDLSGTSNLDTVGNAQIDTAVVKYGTGSLEFDGTDDYIEASYVGDLFDFDTADWTMECWVYLQTDSDSRGGIIEIYKDDNNYIRLFRDSGPDIQLRGVSGGTTQFDIQSSAQSQNTWIHVAGVRDGSTIRLFVDGTQVGTDASFSIPDLSDARVVVGLDLAGTDRYFTGYIDDLRITKGVARYTANFTPPTDALPKF
jgi:hypothetical protein